MSDYPPRPSAEMIAPGEQYEAALRWLLHHAPRCRGVTFSLALDDGPDRDHIVLVEGALSPDTSQVSRSISIKRNGATVALQHVVVMAAGTWREREPDSRRKPL